MASTPITGLVELATPPAAGFWFVVVDTTDTTQGPSGSTKKVKDATVFTSPTFTGTVNAAALNLSGDFAINTNKFTVAATTGNTVIAGTIAAGGAITVAYAAAQVIINATSGTASLAFLRAGTQSAGVSSSATDTILFVDHVGSTLGSFVGTAFSAGAIAGSGDFAIATNKFTVASATGNTLAAGTLDVTGDFKINTNKFVVTASTGATTATSLAVTAGLTSSGATGSGIGYATGAGGAVTQASSRSTAVTINTLCGAITTDSTALSGGVSVTATVNNSTVAIGDDVIVTLRSGASGTLTFVSVSTVANGSFILKTYNASGSNETGALVVNFAVIKAVSA